MEEGKKERMVDLHGMEYGATGVLEPISMRRTIEIIARIRYHYVLELLGYRNAMFTCSMIFSISSCSYNDGIKKS